MGRRREPRLAPPAPIALPDEEADRAGSVALTMSAASAITIVGDQTRGWRAGRYTAAQSIARVRAAASLK